jgi:ubiquinone/menaquinone biosynthesis C-methylase UbiE
MAAGFDRVATVYRLLERLAFGRQLERARFAHLRALRSCRNILIVGDGDGRCLEMVLHMAPEATITSIDASRAMQALARRRVEAAGEGARVTFECADIRTTPLPPAHYDAVLTMFVLDCFQPGDAAVVVSRVAAAVTADGQWLFADFAVPARGWRRLHGQVQVALLYAFFRWQTGISASRLPPSEALIDGHGFRCHDVQERRAGSIRSVLFGRPSA